MDPIKVQRAAIKRMKEPADSSQNEGKALGAYKGMSTKQPQRVATPWSVTNANAPKGNVKPVGPKKGY